MKKLIIAALAAGVAFAAMPAAAADGCGRGYHRTPRGVCRPNMGPRRGPVLVVGRYYQNRGYWDGRRYYRQRYRYHNGWRYR